MAGTTWNPSDKSAAVTLSNGNLTATKTSSPYNEWVRAVARWALTGKYYWECRFDNLTDAGPGSGVGVLLGDAPQGSLDNICFSRNQVGLFANGAIWRDGNNLSSTYGTGTLVNGNVVGIALDIDNNRIWFRLVGLGNWNSTAAGADPATGVGGIALLGSLFAYYPAASLYTTGDQITANFGDTAFAGTVPSGFTSGFPAGTAPPLRAGVTQTVQEQWVSVVAQISPVLVDTDDTLPSPAVIGPSQPLSAGIVSDNDVVRSTVIRAAAKWLWFNGLPLQTVTPQFGVRLGSQKYWFNGLPMSPYMAAAVIPDSNIAPDPFYDSDVFYSSSVTTSAGLFAPSLVGDDVLYAPNVAVGPWLLLPTRVADSETIYAPGLAAGAVAFSPSLVINDDVFYAPSATAALPGSLVPALLAETDTIHAPAILNTKQVLLPARVPDADTFYAPAFLVAPGPQSLLPVRVPDADVFFVPIFGQDRMLRPALVQSADFFWPPYNVDTVKLPHEQKLRAPLVPGPDTIYPPFFPRTPLVYLDQDFIYAVITQAEYPLRPVPLANDDVIRSPFVAMQGQAGLVRDDDAIYRPGISLFLVPQLVADPETIPAADVGWQVIAEVTASDDVVYGVGVSAYNELLPETLVEEDEINTYPFFVQKVTGGVPVPDRIDLKGSIAYPRRLRGSMSNQIRLKGSISRRRELIGSMKHR